MNGTSAGSRVTRVAMWSGPRNLSTALMRSWENRPDTAVLDEPFYAHYLDHTGLDHPVAARVIEAGPVEEARAIARCLADPAGGETVSYQKHMAHHLLPGMDRSWLDLVHNVLLVRHPARVLASYVKKREVVTLTDLGLPQQLELLDRLRERAPVLDSDEFLTDPPAHLERLCAHVGIDFDPSMLAWPAGERSSDGVWADHWYDAVRASTGFGPAPLGPLPELPDEMTDLLDRAIEIYDQVRLRGQRLMD
jgi:hypothetical protein